jgi:hypothetical protein
VGRPDGRYDLFRFDRGRIELDTEWRQRVSDGVGDRGRRRDGAAFAHPFDTKRVKHSSAATDSRSPWAQRFGSSLTLRDNI